MVEPEVLAAADDDVDLSVGGAPVPSVRVVIEVDGAYHATRRVADARRDRELGRRGWRVLRLPAELLARDAAEAVAQVRAALSGGG
jgi:very-short-patch-repair endonuclease